MINLDNDVLNKERRKLFPKIGTLSNRLSLNTMNFLKQQNPFKFYHSFYFKHLKNYEKKQIRLKSSKSVSFLKLLSNAKNYFYSLPIKYDSSNEKQEIKPYTDLELNKLVNNSKINKINKNESTYNVSEINYIDFLKNKALINLYKSLRGNKKLRNINAKKKEENKILLDNNTNKSCFNMYMKNINNKINKTDKDNNNFNFKKLQKLQIKNYNHRYSKELMIEEYKFDKQEYEKKKEEKKFSVEFTKTKVDSLIEDNRNKKSKKNSMTSCDNIYKANIYWSNLRRPIVIYPSNSLIIK